MPEGTDLQLAQKQTTYENCILGFYEIDKAGEDGSIWQQ